MFSSQETTNKKIMRAVWNGEVIAESNHTILIDGNHYFPPQSINQEYFNSSDTATTCAWKGRASYYTLAVNSQINMDAAWFFSNPEEAIREIKDFVAFWKGVEISE